jgi:hypothetical protein
MGAIASDWIASMSYGAGRSTAAVCICVVRSEKVKGVAAAMDDPRALACAAKGHDKGAMAPSVVSPFLLCILARESGESSEQTRKDMVTPLMLTQDYVVILSS